MRSVRYIVVCHITRVYCKTNFFSTSHIMRKKITPQNVIGKHANLPNLDKNGIFMNEKGAKRRFLMHDIKGV